MNNNIDVDSYIDDQSLPIVAREMFRQILGYCYEEIAHSNLLISSLKGIQSNEDRLKVLESFPSALESILISFTNIVRELENFGSNMQLKSITRLMDGRETFEKKSLENLTLKEISELFEGISSKNLNLESISEDQVRMVLIIILLYSVVEFTILEKRLITELKGDYCLIANRLNSEISEIVGIYLRLKTIPIVTKHMSKILNEKQKNSNRGKDKKGKNNLFNGFIKWALALPDNHGYRWPIHAARDYCDQLKVSKDKESLELARQIGGKSPRIMCEKLDKHCKDNNILNPFKSYFN